MSATKNKSAEKRSVKRFRVLHNGAPCKVVFDFHELGCVVPAGKACVDAVFKTKIRADHAIARTYAAKAKADACYFPDFRGFDPLRFDLGGLSVEEFMMDIAAGDEE